MEKKTAWTIAGSAAIPIVASRLTDPSGAEGLRKLSFGTSLASGIIYLLTKSTTAGAVALGTGGAWAVMRGP